MKTGKTLVILVMVVSLLGSSAGCLENPNQNIKGWVVNAHTERVKVDIYKGSTGELEDSVKVMTGESVKIWLGPGNYEIEAYTTDGVFIGSIDFRLKPGESDFYISVFTNKVTARSN